MPDTQRKLTSCHLLIIEDDATGAAVLKRYLTSEGYTNLDFAINGKQGLEKMLYSQPDIIILDLMMPEMDGFEFLKRVKSNSLWAHIPIIVQTALENEKDKIFVFDMGASDYVNKPLKIHELLARIRVHLLNKLLLEEITERQHEMQIEMRAAQAMQEKIMPSEQQLRAMEETYQLHIARHFETSSLMGGDCWGMQQLTPTRLGVFIYDFSGHGVTAALNVFRMHTLMHELMHQANDAGAYLTALNKHIFPLIERSEFATMFYGIIDTEKNCLEYASAAAAPTLVCRSKDGSKEWLDSRGFPLGATASGIYETLSSPFNSGDALIMFSDCLTETEDSRGQLISEETIGEDIEQSLATHSDHPASHIIDTLLTHFRNHNQAPIGDDLTMNVYCRK